MKFEVKEIYEGGTMMTKNRKDFWIALLMTILLFSGTGLIIWITFVFHLIAGFIVSAIITGLAFVVVFNSLRDIISLRG